MHTNATMKCGPKSPIKPHPLNIIGYCMQFFICAQFNVEQQMHKVILFVGILQRSPELYCLF